MPARILVVEDNSTNLELMVYLLKSFGYEHIVARDGVEGLKLARSERPDIIICDIQLPNMDGYEVARRLKSEPALRTIPLVAVTALAMVGDRDKVLASGFNGYIAKPIGPETFISQVEEFLPSSQRSGVKWTRPVSTATAPTYDIPRPSGRGTILVVDDTAQNISLSRSVLEPSGYKVVAADCLADAWAAVRRERPDLILSDVHLPDGNGYDLLSLVRGDAELASLPFLMISATSTNPGERILGRSAGGVQFILRPIESARLLEEIESCLQARLIAPSNALGGAHGDDPRG
jgi:two-component system cell cycle response regulator